MILVILEYCVSILVATLIPTTVVYVTITYEIAYIALLGNVSRHKIKPRPVRFG